MYFLIPHYQSYQHDSYAVVATLQYEHLIQICTNHAHGNVIFWVKP